MSAGAWVDLVASGAGSEAAGFVTQLSVAQIRARLDPGGGGPDRRYVADLVLRSREVSLRARIEEASGALRRAESDDPGRVHAIAVQLNGLQRELALLREALD